MTEHPIIFSTPMVQAILEGKKAQTRRVIKPQPHKSWDEQPYFVEVPRTWCFHGHDGWGYKKCPYGQVGDTLWCKETWMTDKKYDLLKPSEIPDVGRIVPLWYWASGNHYADKVSQGAGRIRPSIFMPRWASRITLTSTSIKAQRPIDLTEEEAILEGVKDKSDFIEGIKRIDGEDCLNKWFWVYEFPKV